ncbi:methylmalonyl-CoA mutase family protein [Algivirga pacifica]|uniref:Methylmalonyl-CoA mutase alpha/beta chain catalytic domain-containing protein n=1 Tax=Algivirga pacifica TaxID=1162670 RepID=A0ABP9D816_9BACT
MNSVNLFNEFSETTKNEWKDVAVKSLKGGDYERICWYPEKEDFFVEPIYTAEERSSLKGLLQTVYQQDNAWDNCQHVDVLHFGEANKKALEALSNGADSVTFDLSAFVLEDFDLPVLLNDILLQHCKVNFIIKEELMGFLKCYQELVKARQVSFDQIRGTVRSLFSDSDEIALGIQTSVFPSLKLNIIGNLDEIKVTKRISELIDVLVERINYFTEKGIAVEDIFKHTEYVLDVKNNYFFELAGLRALRFLHSKVGEKVGVQHPELLEARIHTFTSLNQVNEGADLNHNLLSNTTQAMSAILGGCTTLSVKPHVWGKQEVTPFSERIARNVSNILKKEAYLDRVEDPAAGSYYIESLTEKIAKSAWEQFQVK